MFQWSILELISFYLNDLVDSQLTCLYSLLLFNTSLVKTLDWLYTLTPLFTIKTTMLNATVITIKFVLLIALLVFVRGGIPRYRYDFLTKVGWIKFLSLILAVFLSSILLIYTA